MTTEYSPASPEIPFDPGGTLGDWAETLRLMAAAEDASGLAGVISRQLAYDEASRLDQGLGPVDHAHDIPRVLSNVDVAASLADGGKPGPVTEFVTTTLEGRLISDIVPPPWMCHGLPDYRLTRQTDQN